MSLTQGLSAAFSGLTAAARGAETIAANLANQSTPGYARRETLLDSLPRSGVQVTGIGRHANPALLAERRLAEGARSALDLRLGFLSDLEGRLGVPGSADSLTGRIARFEAALTTAAASPGTEAALLGVRDSAVDLAAQLRDLTATVQGARTAADAAVERDVAQVNGALEQVAQLNTEIRRLVALGQDTSSLQDQRQTVVDSIAMRIPLREVPRDGGQVSLFATGGAVLLDGRPARLGFVATPTITASTAGLSGLTLDGYALSAAPDGPVGGGSLVANLALRDDLAPAAQGRLDALARDLLGRTASADPTLAPGALGLFTDGGSVLVPGSETGLAGRISLNAAVDPDRGGDLWRLRSGIGAAVAGPSGDGAILSGLAQAMADARVPVSPALTPDRRSLATLAGDVVSGIATARVQTDAEATRAAARVATLTGLEAQGGVDSDQEMQALLLIERSYAANARVIQAVERMLDSLLEI